MFHSVGFLLFKLLEDQLYLIFCFVGAELICGVGFTEQVMGDIVIVFFKDRDLAVFDESIAVYAVTLDTVEQSCNKVDIRRFFHLEGDIIATLEFYRAYSVCRGIFLYIFAQGAERACAKPREKTPRVAAEMDERMIEHTRVLCGLTRLNKALDGIFF